MKELIEILKMIYDSIMALEGYIIILIAIILLYYIM